MNNTEPVFIADGTWWIPSAVSRGPFRGLHGGAVSGLVVAVMEARAQSEGWGMALSASIYMLRPTPLAPLTTKLSVLRVGGRVAMLENELYAEDKLVAKGTASFGHGIEMSELARVALPAQAADPASMPEWQGPAKQFKHLTFFHAMEIRDDGNGTKWGRLTQPLMPFHAPFASLFALADNATPYWLSTTEFWPPPWSGFPNIDLTLHVSRAPQGEWVGIAPTSDWRPSGIGLTEARIYDQTGLLGRSCQSVMLVP